MTMPAGRRVAALVACLLAILLWGPTASAVWAQDTGPGLKARVERQWQVVPLREGLLLVPRVSIPGVEGIELSGRSVAVDGREVSDAELRERLGDRAEAILGLMALGSTERVALFSKQPAPVEPEAATEPGSGWDDREGAEVRTSRGARVRIGGDVFVGEDERIGDEVVAIFGSATVRGKVRGDVVAVFGDVRLGPKAEVGGEVTAVGGEIVREEGARVYGAVNEVSIGIPRISVNVPDVSPVHVEFPWTHRSWPRLLAGAAFVGMSLRMLAVALLAFVVVLVAPGAVAKIRGTLERAPAQSLLAGVVGGVLIPPAFIALCVVLLVSVIGIPLLALVPFILLAVLVAWAVGFTAVAWSLGARLTGASDQDGRPYGSLVLGLAAVWALSLVGRAIWWMNGSLSWPIAILVGAGFAIELIAGAWALGALLLTWFNRSTAPAPPPVPTAPTAESVSGGAGL